MKVQRFFYPISMFDVTKQIQTNNLQKGMYILKIVYAIGFKTKKIIIQ